MIHRRSFRVDPLRCNQAANPWLAMVQPNC